MANPTRASCWPGATLIAFMFVVVIWVRYVDSSTRILSPSLDVAGQSEGRIEMGNHDGENSSRLSYNINLFMNRPPRSGGRSKRR